MNDPFDNRPSFDDEQLEHLADLVAIKLAAMRPAADPMLTVAEVARTFKVSRAWVYENAARLGAVKLGPGERAPLRFDAGVVTRALRPLGEPVEHARPASASKPPQALRRSRSKRLHPVYDG